MFAPKAAVVLTMVGAFALPGAAQAASTVSLVGGVLTITGDDAVNRFATTEYFTRAQIQDDQPGAIVSPGTGCVQGSTQSSVDCGDFPVGATVVANLGGGDDTYKWATINPSQTIDGGEGNDTIEAGAGNDTVRGGPGKDDLNGARGDDAMDGGDGDDKVDGWDGSDSVTGGAGRDNLLGDGGTLYSGGNDTIFARDGEPDSVDCGGGADRAEVDAVGTDVVSYCASTIVPATSGGAPTTGGPGSIPPAPTALTVAGGISAKQTPSALASGKKFSLRVTANATCSAQAALAITKTEAKRLGLGKKGVTLGMSASVELAANTPATIPLGVSQRYRGKLRKAKRIKAAVVIVCLDASGRTFSGQLDVTLGR